MIKINRKERIYLKTLIECLPENCCGRIYIYLDPCKAEYVLLRNESKSNKYKLLGIAEGDGDILRRSIKTIIHDYDKNPNIICQSEVIRKFGKKGLIDKAFVREVDNPHYKCAGKMRLYDVNVIKANTSIVHL